MIDKLTLYSKEYHVKDASVIPMLIHQSPLPTNEKIDSLTPLFVDGTDERYHGHRASLNTKLYQTTINHKGLLVQFNPSKPYHAYNLVDDNDQLKARIKNVTDDLQHHGIIADWNNAKIGRIDLAKNAVMNNPVSTYHNVFNWLSVKRSKRQALYPDGYSSGNNSFGTIIYNKGKEINDSNIYAKDNLLRAELQFKCVSSVKSALGINTLDDLQHHGIKYLKTVYKKVIGDRVFNQKEISNSQYQIVFNDELQALKQVIDMYGERSALNHYLQIKGINTIISEYGSIDTFDLLLKEVGFHRSSRHRAKKKLQQHLQLHAKLWRDKKNTVSKLYRELITKIAV